VPDSPNSLTQADPRAFGRLIAKIREANGMTQPEVANRVPGHYGEASTYRRIELGSRKCSRDAAIAILRHGLQVSSLAVINSGLALLAYAPLNPEEIGALHLANSGNQAMTVPAEKIPDRQAGWLVRLSASRTATSAGLVTISLVLAVVAARRMPFAAAVFGSAIVYAALYAVSVLLETQHQADHRRRPTAAALAFALMLIASVAALALDGWLVRTGSGAGLWAAFAVCWTAAGAQWFMVRPALADRAVVPLRFQAHTAQAAHLKNTLYFLLLASVFWLPPLHAVAVLRRELQFGHTAFVQQAISHPALIMGRSIISLGPEALMAVLIAVLGAAAVMGSRLLDNLKPDPRQNGYCVLLYTRTALFFGLSFLCIGWYADKLGGLLG
jgi:transcriptional regulator with XRE-family HTH domain